MFEKILKNLIVILQKTETGNFLVFETTRRLGIFHKIKIESTRTLINDLYFESFLMSTSTYDLDVCISKLFDGEKLSAPQIKYFCNQLKDELMSSPNIVVVHSPISVVGDVHG